jgi:hypothetical protein
MVIQAFGRAIHHIGLFTTKSTKSTKDTKVLDNLNSALRPKAFGRQAELRALRVLRGENIFTITPEEPNL